MYYPELRNYLTLTTDTDMVDRFDKAVEIFDLHGIEDYMDVYDDVVGNTSHLGDQEVIDGLVNCLNSQLTALLLACGVVANEDTPTSMMLDLSKGLALLPDYEDRGAVGLVLSMDHSPQETFAELMQLVTTVHSDVCLSYIESVSESFIGNLKDMLEVETADHIAIASDTAKQVTDYLKLKSLFQNTPMWTDQFLHHNEAIGLPYVTYLRLYLEERNDYLALVNTEAAYRTVAAELIAMACLSIETADKAQATVKEHMDEVYSDINMVTKLDLAVTAVLGSYYHA